MINHDLTFINDHKLTKFIVCVGRYCGDFRVEMIMFSIAAV